MAGEAKEEAVESRGKRIRRRLLWGAFGLFFVVVIGIVLFGRWSVHRAYPQTAGTITVPGLDGEVEIIRDEFGVPHIYADTPHDLFMAQGFVHSQDRFFQMDFWRHISHGTLSEMFGDSQIDTDTFIRTLGWGDLAQRQYETDSDGLRAILDAYAAGVNAYIGERPQKDLGFEYTILSFINGGYTVEPWTGAQSLAWGKVMSWDLGGNLGREIERAMALASMPADRVDQLFPPYPLDRHPTIVGEGASAASAVEAGYTIPEAALKPLAETFTAIAALNRWSWKSPAAASSPVERSIVASAPTRGPCPATGHRPGARCLRTTRTSACRCLRSGTRSASTAEP